MTLTAYAGGVGPRFPNWEDLGIGNVNNGALLQVVNNSSNQVIDAVNESTAMIGRLFIYGRPTGTKTISSAGGKIHFLPGTLTWASAGSKIRFGLQGVATGSGPPFQNDTTYSTYADLVQGTDTLTSNTWKTVTLSTGSSSLSHGDLISIVATMTVQNGADALRFATGQGTGGNFPGCANFLGGAWNTTAPGYLPICLIEFDDGTLGILARTIPVSAITNETWTDATNPDERGLMFQVEDAVKVGALWMYLGPSAATGDFDIFVYSDPLGTPTQIYTASILAEQLSGTFAKLYNHEIAAGSEISLSANTDYAFVVKATGAGNVTLQYFTFANSAYRRFIQNGLNLRKGYRNALTGAFSETTTLIPAMGIQLSHRDVSAGGGGLMINSGMQGGMQG